MGCGASCEAQRPDETHNEYVVRKQAQTMKKLSVEDKQMYLTHNVSLRLITELTHHIFCVV